MKRIFICAAESSGDSLAASLVDELRRRRSDLDFAGLTGPLMRRSGVASIARGEDVTVMGVAEALWRVGPAARTIWLLERALRRWRPDLLITVDSPSLLLRLAGRAKRRGIATIHWVSPQVWAWRTHRVHRIARSVDCLLCLFAMEPPLYEGLGLRALFVGHPAADGVLPKMKSQPGLRIGLAPGSRQSEVANLWPILVKTGHLIRQKHPHCRFVVPVAPSVRLSWLTGLAAEFCPGIPQMAAQVDGAVVASGTATAELAVAGTPMVVIYKVHPLSWTIGRRVVTGVENIALPNILAKRQIVPEYIQHLRPAVIAEALMEQIASPPDLSEATGALGPAGCIVRAADEVERWL